MRGRLALVTLLVVCGTLGTLTAWWRPLPPTQSSPPAARQPVRLAVLVVFDQLRGDFLERWQPLFGPDGFRRLQTDGAWFIHCHYPYGTTATGPGHASMLTGTCPDRHGIINNNWYENGEDVYCAGSPRYQLVPASRSSAEGGKGDGQRGDTKSAPPTSKPRPAGTPERLLAETVADVLRQTHPQAKIFGLSLKDRSAILPVGRRPDGAFWFTTRFVTSTYYADALPAWAEAFNRSGTAESWLDAVWDRCRPDLDYAVHSGPDDAPGEGTGVRITAAKDPDRGWSQGRTFPHPLRPKGRRPPDRTYYEALANSPFGNDLLLAFARVCLREEKLGADDVPDLLVISFSSNDLVGHAWGPDSQEVLDITLRSDRQLAELLRLLDEQVGRGRYLLALTADHGVCPLPEASQRQQMDARRVDVRRLVRQMEEHLQAKWKLPADSGEKAAWVEAVSFPWLYLNGRWIERAGLSRAEVAAAAAAFLHRQPEVYRAYTRNDLQAVSKSDGSAAAPGTPSGSGQNAANQPDATNQSDLANRREGMDHRQVIDRRMARSYHPQRSGDIAIVLRPYYLPASSGDTATATGTTHGTPFAYDTHVPLLVYGPGIPGGVRREPVTPQAVAAIFAQALGIRPPAQAEFPVPADLYRVPAGR